MNEDYVTYEQAVKLKELGFDWSTRACFTVKPDGKPNLWGTGFKILKSNLKGRSVLAPTLARAQKWLRKKKNWHVEVRINGCRNMFCVQLWEMEANGRHELLEHNDGHAMLFDTYESALSAGITSALGLLATKTSKE